MFSKLENSPTQPEVKRVENVLNLLVAAETHERERRSLNARTLKTSDRAVLLDLHRKWKTLMPVCERTLGELNDALRRYRWGATVFGEDGLQTVIHPVFRDEKTWTYWETFIVGQLLECANKPDELSRFRRCSECQNWFHAVRGHQHFCGESCRRRHAAQDSEFKEKRRIYMRERYRPLQKELQERSLPSRKQTRQTKGRG
jgi:hypothetical protein